MFFYCLLFRICSPYVSPSPVTWSCLLWFHTFVIYGLFIERLLHHPSQPPSQEKTIFYYFLNGRLLIKVFLVCCTLCWSLVLGPGLHTWQRHPKGRGFIIMSPAGRNVGRRVGLEALSLAVLVHVVANSEAKSCTGARVIKTQREKLEFNLEWKPEEQSNQTTREVRPLPRRGADSVD